MIENITKCDIFSMFQGDHLGRPLTAKWTIELGQKYDVLEIKITSSNVFHGK